MIEAVPASPISPEKIRAEKHPAVAGRWTIYGTDISS